jgi:hypothetical protein|tara:strand:- start:1666 stop:2163 length:498 start_codon:yes stop_codon:yes gene_type:complete
MIHIGIDNGLSGGIAAIEDGTLSLDVMPILNDGKKNRVDVIKLMRILQSYYRSDCSSFIVYESPAGSKSVKAAVSMADSFARVEAILIIERYRREPITSRKWQKIFWTVPKMPKGKSFDTKAAALNKARQLFPNQDWLTSSRCRKPHDGLIDAALIAEYCRRVYK